MRRTPSIDSPSLIAAGGNATGQVDPNPYFEAAFRELADARAAYDSVTGNPELVPSLAAAAARLSSARLQITTLRTAA
jgi:hypothetical protein